MATEVDPKHNLTAADGSALSPSGPSGAAPAVRRSWRRMLLIPIGVGALALLIVLGLKLSQGDNQLGEVKLHPYPAPAFSLGLFDGGNFSLDGQRGKIVVVNFWASWCVPCQSEAPVLEQSWQRYRGKGVDFVGVDIKDTPQDARGFLQRYAASYPNGFDAQKQIYINYGVYGLPETFVVNQQGLILHHVIGPVTSVQLDGWLAPLLDSATPQP